MTSDGDRTSIHPPATIRGPQGLILSKSNSITYINPTDYHYPCADRVLVLEPGRHRLRLTSPQRDWSLPPGGAQRVAVRVAVRALYAPRSWTVEIPEPPNELALIALNSSVFTVVGLLVTPHQAEVGPRV